MAEPSRPARLWYQSFVHPVEQAPYIDRLQGMLDEVAAHGSRFEVHGLDPPDHSFHPLTEFRCANQVIGNALQADREGYDAFVMPVKTGTGTLYRVRIGPMDDRDAAARTLAKIKPKAADAKVVKHP